MKRVLKGMSFGGAQGKRVQQNLLISNRVLNKLNTNGNRMPSNIVWADILNKINVNLKLKVTYGGY